MESMKSRKFSWPSMNRKVYVGLQLPMKVRWAAMDSIALLPSKLQLKIVKPFRPSLETTANGGTVLSSFLPRSMTALKSMKYLPVLKLAHQSSPSVDFTKVQLRCSTGQMSFRPNQKENLKDKHGNINEICSPVDSEESTSSSPDNELLGSMSALGVNYDYDNDDVNNIPILPVESQVPFIDESSSSLAFQIAGKRFIAENHLAKRDLTSSIVQNSSTDSIDEEGGPRHFVKIQPLSLPAQDDSAESGRQKQHMVPSWSTMQFNRRPVINTPWMKDTQNVAMNTVNNINGAMLELSDTDIQRETAKANLVLVQRMAELVLAEKDKVKAEMSRVQTDLERLASERDRNLMETQKLDMEREMYEAKLLSGTARGELYKKSMASRKR